MSDWLILVESLSDIGQAETRIKSCGFQTI